MGVHDNSQDDVVLKEGLERAEEEGEAGGGVDHPLHEGVPVAAEPGFRYLNVGVPLPGNEAELDLRRRLGVVAAPGEAKAASR